ncbi:hypothetical protein [Lactococcus petauri]|uniref:hypothetical protein n=1 Tax=Lactococcus petauri TaxID=1940789 RepID=UPI00254DE033|nr:hypothetical protein [Lactococcus petauri]
MTEKSEERIYREAKKRIDMRKNGIHPSDYFEGWVVDYIDSVTTDKLSVEKLQEQLNTAKKHIEHVIGTIKHDGHLGTIQTDWILPYLEKALAAIGGDDD